MEDSSLERIIDYVNKKNLGSGITLTPKEVMDFYHSEKMINPTKAFIHTLNYIDNYIKERKI